MPGDLGANQFWLQRLRAVPIPLDPGVYQFHGLADRGGPHQLIPWSTYRCNTATSSRRQAAKGLLRHPGWHRTSQIRCLF